MKYTCKHGFIVPEHLSNFHDHILVVHLEPRGCEAAHCKNHTGKFV